MALSDQKLVELSRQFQAIKAEISAFTLERKPKLDRLQARIVAEMQRQGRKTFSSLGTKVTMTQAEKTEYDLTKLKRTLRNQPEVLQRVIVESLNRAALESEIEAGNITPKQVARFSSIKQNAAYITVS